MLVEGIKSRPVYGVLAPQPGLSHIIVAEGEGAEAVLRMAEAAPAGFFAKSHLIFVPRGGDRPDRADGLRALGAADFQSVGSPADAAAAVATLLRDAKMGTQVYVTGTEGLIGLVVQAAETAGIDHASIHTEHRGSMARRVQCVHCKGITENVTTQPVKCSHCGLTLLVRDHYSRRIGAFQGVCIDAEEPGTAPRPEELFK
ncbi:dimethylamine monooxygenase subunit DmmA family protein [Lutibaculum baratangense]|uniref:Uncharacterized protein n=1 Tax=Lutibaculum baratangense AMV1 TaxID=631454 RepID=V4R100_9HYPH|nr:dimethylamine monooxygenase subunit DmmA family protein [Lutibaculum baratangense]ESR25677.1 hypothetical protein N177_1510 [Lutibaculum baratangense AMV1]